MDLSPNWNRLRAMLKTTKTIKKKIKNVVHEMPPLSRDTGGFFLGPGFAAQEEANHE